MYTALYGIYFVEYRKLWVANRRMWECIWNRSIIATSVVWHWECARLDKLSWKVAEKFLCIFIFFIRSSLPISSLFFPLLPTKILHRDNINSMRNYDEESEKITYSSALTISFFYLAFFSRSLRFSFVMFANITELFFPSSNDPHWIDGVGIEH